MTFIRFILFSCGRIRQILAGVVFVCTFSQAQVNSAVPVLCYHGFAGDTSSAQGKLTEKYSRFEKMLQFLLGHGYQTVFPEELVAEHANFSKPIILTFDDGRKEQLRAAEMMKNLGVRGIFFIVPSRISSGRLDYMNKEDLSRLISWGHQIGVHGYSHRSMVEVPEETENVRTRALAVLQEAIPAQTDFPNFAYPFGHYDTSVVEVISEFYRYLHTVSPGYWDGHSRQVPRMLITSDKPGEFFQDYILKSSQYQPSLSPLLKDGSQANVIPFRVVRPVSFSELEIIAVSEDREGYHYASHPVADVVSIQENVLFFDMRKFLKLFFRDTRAVLSYAFITRADSSLRYLSSGQTNWMAK